jgi:hypothetical protein
MAPGRNTRTLTVNGISQTVEILRSEPMANTGDTRQIARDSNGNLIALESYFGVDSTPTDTPTGDQWGTLR